MRARPSRRMRADPPHRSPLKRRIRLVVSIVGPLVILGLLVYLIASKGSQIEQAATTAPAPAISCS